jgi:phosphoglycolate phosphatase
VGLDRAFGYTGLKPHFHITRCGDEGFGKPHPEMLEKIMDFTGVTPSRTVMIGDTTHDLDLAKNAGVDAIAVTYGAHPREVLALRESRVTVDNVAELSAWLHAFG